jgi:tetratricopeptide (TPR) repeat protein
VTRVYAGKTVEERFIAPEAYAHYTEGQLHEAGGDDASAEQEYLASLDIDPESADTWTRLGAVRCRLGTAFSDAFAEAESLDREYAPLWRERAICELRRGDAKRALDWSKRAVALDPDDSRASLAVTAALDKLGQRAEAARWRGALLLRDPGAERVEKAALELAKRGRSKAPKPARRSTRPTKHDVDNALLHEPLERVREVALASGVRVSELAMRAAALGLTSTADTEARRVLAADPDDTDAWIAALIAADLAGDEARFQSTSALLGPEPLAPGPLARRLFAELLARRVSPEAAKSFLGGEPLPPAVDALERKLDQRLQALGVAN